MQCFKDQQEITNVAYDIIGYGRGQINICKFFRLKIKMNDLLPYRAYNLMFLKTVGWVLHRASFYCDGTVYKISIRVLGKIKAYIWVRQ